MPQLLKSQDEELKTLAGQDLIGTAVADHTAQMVLHSREMLRQADRVELISRVARKRYFSFRGQDQSRPINRDLYVDDAGEFDRLLRSFRGGFRNSSDEDTLRSTYTIAYGIFAAHDVYKVGRKASATFFEILVGHTLGRRLGVSPRKRVRIPESGADLPTDYVFDLGQGNRKLHLPIKTSTRERAVQAWVHQLVLDRIFGSGQYRGILVVAAETKRDSRTGEVIEICVPQQLQMFQSRVAEISRVYYLDAPQAYLALAKNFPRLEVRNFGGVFEDLRQLLRT